MAAMTLFDRGTLSCPRLVDYFLQAARPKERFAVGMEVEKLGTDPANGGALPYDGARRSVRAVLAAYHARRGGQTIHEGDHLIGLDGTWGTLSLEPGGQTEWSSRPAPTLDVLRIDLKAHLDVMRELEVALGIRWLDVGVHPTQAVAEAPWMPKARYVIMRDHLGARGRLAHRMMKQTTGIQAAFDFSSAEDWSRKFRTAALTMPVAVALFANSSRADGAETGWRSFRQAIWRETDPDRCGLPTVVFDPAFDIEAWVEHVLDVPAIFRYRHQGLVGAGGRPFREYLDRVGCDSVGIDDWELHLSTVFTEVRSYSYIEVRAHDLQPDPLILSVPAFWTGILYHDGALDAARELGAPYDSPAAWADAMERAARAALDDPELRDRAAQALGIAVHALRDGAACAGSSSDAAAPLLELAEARGITPAGAVR